MNPLTAPVDETAKANCVPRKPLTVAIIGFGTVGSSVARILTEHAPEGLRLSYVFNRNFERKRKAADWISPIVQWTDNIEDILSSDVDIVVELVGGLEPAGTWIRRAVGSGKSVVTGNKQVVARYGPELVAQAHARGGHVAFGASVAGGVPLISGLQEGLAGDELVDDAVILSRRLPRRAADQPERSHRFHRAAHLRRTSSRSSRELAATAGNVFSR